ncbi:hypothetical protein IL306_007870 [Fusarium sp. DS 682]|nr:hypothetical protein IL306_007870 [Fusarium sp. DS 682]
MTRIRQLELEHPDYRATSSSFYPWMGAPERGTVPGSANSERVDEYLPCHYFDYVAGTSTGGIAVSWAINKEGGVSKQFVWRSYDNNFTPRANDSNGWKPSNAGPADTTAIWEVARATTAAPRYFESIKIRGKKFLDGGMVANNPSLLAIREIHNLHGLVPALFVSIGTGLKTAGQRTPREANGDITALRRAATRDNVRRKQFLKNYIEIGRQMTHSMVDCEGENGTNGWRAHCNAIGLKEDSYRLNVEGDLHTIPLDDWRPSNTGEDTLEFIRTQTEAYLEQGKVREYIDAIARKAVEIRRLRAATEQWERFAVDVAYCCPTCYRRPYDTRAKLREHLQKGSEHQGRNRIEERQLEEVLNDARTVKSKRSETANGR